MFGGLSMIQEHKEILFKDLSARLPYHVRLKVQLKDRTTEEGFLDLKHNYGDVLRDAFYYNEIIDIKPYLFPLSSMTEEEWEDCQKIRMMDWAHGDINGTFINAGLTVDWLNAHHFDYRNLINKNLAIDCTNLNIY